MGKEMKLFQAIIFIIVFPLTLQAGNPVSSAEHVFMSRQAAATISAARERDDFLQAASDYSALIESGVKNGAVFYNMGTALLKAEEFEAAVQAFLRAERYTGTTWEIERNLRLAMAADGEVREQSLPWHRVPLFWHYGLGMNTRALIGTYGFAFFWLGMTLRLFGIKRFTVSLMTAALTVMITFGSSALTSLHGEMRDRAIRVPSPSAAETEVE